MRAAKMPENAHFPKLNWIGQIAHADTECLPSSLETGRQLNADRRVYVSIKPDARGINPRGRRGGGGREGSIDRAD